MVRSRISSVETFNTQIQVINFLLLRLSFQPVVEMTWVIGDHVAAPGSQELTVHKGQQVEVLDVNTASPDWCLVRMPTSGSVDSPPEGLVPLSVLKQPPGVRTSPSRKNPNDPDLGK